MPFTADASPSGDGPSSRHADTPATDASVLLLPPSDSHLFAEDGARLLGMDTAHSLEEVVERGARG
ncbi:hypothetical protein ACV33N_31030, partial [Pseudomonas aeruginosa]